MPISRAYLRDLFNRLAENMNAHADALGEAAAELYEEIIAGLPESEREDAAQKYGPEIDRDTRIERLERRIASGGKMIESGFASPEAEELHDRLKRLRDLLKAQKELERLATTFRDIAAEYQ